jgi:hypothetical protein
VSLFYLKIFFSRADVLTTKTTKTTKKKLVPQAFSVNPWAVNHPCATFLGWFSPRLGGPGRGIPPGKGGLYRLYRFYRLKTEVSLFYFKIFFSRSRPAKTQVPVKTQVKATTDQLR